MKKEYIVKKWQVGVSVLIFITICVITFGYGFLKGDDIDQNITVIGIVSIFGSLLIAGVILVNYYSQKNYKTIQGKVTKIEPVIVNDVVDYLIITFDNNETIKCNTNKYANFTVNSKLIVEFSKFVRPDTDVWNIRSITKSPN